ncbi:LysM domain protein [Cordyceps militaris]|uniref:LysM domain protein n=1 Tax=Cordyceps militaris TaxID=73501 RepID=A0A2H4SFJ0_CORMI|nr:LysM domain protein [Cordyceps militaris]
MKFSVAIFAFLPLLALAEDGLAPEDRPWPDISLWQRISSKPHMPHDPRTGTPCHVWYNNDGTWDCDTVLSYTTTDRRWFFGWPGMVNNCKKFYAVRYDDTCASVASLFAVSVDDCIMWNDMAGRDCHQLTVKTFVCVFARTGIQTPLPTQVDMVANCNKFHYIWKGNTCDQVTWYNDITQQQFAQWNPKVGLECTSLLPDHHACVGVDGESSIPSATPTPTPTPSSTAPSNGIETPQPTQPDMVSNCNKFHYIWKGNTCGQVTGYNGITQEQFAQWNPKIGLQCHGLHGLWAETYACPDMVGNCNKFHWIWKGNTCGQVTSYNAISHHDLATWNPQVGEQCTGLWAEAYACVGVLAGAATPDKTTPSNGIETPQPTQPGMVDSCKKFHWISKGNTCWQITSHNGISQQDFATWNPQIGEECTGMWADAYACVGV